MVFLFCRYIVFIFVKFCKHLHIRAANVLRVNDYKKKAELEGIKVTRRLPPSIDFSSSEDRCALPILNVGKLIRVFPGNHVNYSNVRILAILFFLYT